MQKKQKVIQRMHEKMLKTSDDFCPNFPDNEVCVHIVYSNIDEERVQLTVFGQDNTAMMIEGSVGDYDRLKNIYNRLPEPITKEWLLDNGFQYV